MQLLGGLAVGNNSINNNNMAVPKVDVDSLRIMRDLELNNKIL